MSPANFRKLAMSLPEAVERAHMDHPDFRVGERGKIFATLGHIEGCAMVKLTPQQQDELVASHDDVFEPVKGGWGVQGATTVHLKPAREEVVRRALIAAWKGVAPKKLLKQIDDHE